MPEMMFLDVIRQALREEMIRDPAVMLMGMDVRAGLWRSTRGLYEEFGEWRVLDTPISEAGFTGVAIGAAMHGFRPVVEYEVSTLPYVSMDQLANQAAKLRYMTGGQVSLPITFLVVSAGGGGGFGSQHSDYTYSTLVNVGMKVAMPSNPYDAKGLLKTCIRDDDPVMFFEVGQLYETRAEVPEEEYLVPLGKAATVRKGKDMTVVALGSLVHEAVKAAERAQSDGISVEVIDPRSLLPLDADTILESVAKTGRLIIAEGGNRVCGFGAEVSAIVTERVFGDLKGPILRVARPVVPVPLSQPLENLMFARSDQVLEAIRRLANQS